MKDMFSDKLTPEKIQKTPENEQENPEKAEES
jgi:hypothetical protein